MKFRHVNEFPKDLEERQFIIRVAFPVINMGAQFAMMLTQLWVTFLHGKLNY